MNHYVMEDDWYEGYFIPKNSVIMINQWALNYDEELYPDPEKVPFALLQLPPPAFSPQVSDDWQYNPERFVHHNLTAGEYAALANVNERDHFSFGGGRRICPGLHIAERSVFINLARLLWGFNIEHARDEKGEIIPVDFTSDGLMPGAMSNAKMFQCCTAPLLPLSFLLLLVWIGGLTWGSDNAAECEEGEDYAG
jgi:cytochrome P450